MKTFFTEGGRGEGEGGQSSVSLSLQKKEGRKEAAICAPPPLTSGDTREGLPGASSRVMSHCLISSESRGRRCVRSLHGTPGGGEGDVAKYARDVVQVNEGDEVSEYNRYLPPLTF